MDDELISQLAKISVSDIHFRRYNKLSQLAIDNVFSNYDYFEMHHYLPRSLFPDYIDDDNNIIRVPGKLHYILHFLLLKITESPQMIMAFNQMNRIRSKSKFTGKLYSNSRKLFADTQKKRKHFYNKTTKEHIFSLEEQSDDWIRGIPPEYNSGKHGKNSWIYNPETNEQRRILIDSKIPPGFVGGRIAGMDTGLSLMNDRKRYFSLMQKKTVFSEIKNADYCNDKGNTVFEVYKFENKATISKKYIIEFLFGIFNDALARKNPHKFIIPEPHFNMNKDWNDFCEKNGGKTLMEIGMKIIPISEFIYTNEDCI